MADAKGAYIGGVPVQFKDAAAREMISDEYNSAETYAKGNLCIYNGKIYEAIKETIGTWDATAWKETTLAEVNAKMRSDITNLTEKSIKADVLEITTNEFSNVNLSNYGYTVENTIAVYVVGGLSGYNAHARLYTYNGLLYALITDSGSNNGFKNTKVKLKILHI